MTTPSGAADALTLQGITHRFGPIVALDRASLRVRAGTVHAVLGENGAGKSTLMRVAFGLLVPDAGDILYHGERVSPRSPVDARARGVGMVHQHFSLVPAMTVAENVALGGRGRYHPVRAAQQVVELGERTGLVLDPHARVASLSVGAQQRCELLKALAGETRLLILDEPTAVLTPGEAQELLRWIRRHADAGHAVVLITHKLRDALAVSDDVTVLHRGRTTVAAPAAECTERTLAAAMLGAALDTAAPPLAAAVAADAGGAPPHPVLPGTPPILAAHGISVVDAHGVSRLLDVTLTVRPYEIVGLAAIEGSGQHELLRAVAGRWPVATGTVTHPATVGFIPEDRHRDALLLDRSLVQNLALRDLAARRGAMPWAALADRTRRILDERDVRAPGVDATARSLSGGNQQKFVVGRELERSPEAVIAENPTRGLDFMATAAVHQALRAERDGGAAVLLYSSDLDEVLAVADRVVVLHAGRLQEAPRDRDAIGRAMLGAGGA